MKRIILNSTLLIAVMLSFNFPIQAQGILDAGKSLLNGSSGAATGKGEGSGTAGSAMGILGALPLDKIIALLRQQGYSNISGLGPSSSGDALQASATNSSGSPVSLLVNPKTGSVISALPK